MSLNYIDFLFLSPLAVIGIACSYTDIKYGKIFNKWTIFSFINIFFLYIFLFFYKVNIDYIFELILNGGIAFLGGYLLWYLKLWSAGDAKLFAVYAFLIPLHFYSKSYIPHFPSFNLLINLFIPLLFVLIIGALITALKEGWNLRNKIKELKLPKMKRISQLSASLSKMFLTYLFVIIILQSFRFLREKPPADEVLSNPFFLFALLFLTIGYLTKKMRGKKWLSLLAYGVILGYSAFLIFSGEPQHLMSILKVALVFMVLVGFTRQILNFYIQKKQIQKIKIKDIQEGMVLVKDKASLVLKKLKEKGEEFGVLDAGGLKKKQAELIKNLFQDNKETEVGVYRTFPFAPFLLLSAVISISTQSSFLPLLDRVFRYFLQ
jgi:hypothetical protein